MVNNKAQHNRGGRPPLAADKARCNRVVTFVTDAEMYKLRNLAREKELSLSSLCHQLIGKSLP